MLPPNRYTAFALQAFMTVAGFKMHQVYRWGCGGRHAALFEQPANFRGWEIGHLFVTSATFACAGVSLPNC